MIEVRDYPSGDAQQLPGHLRDHSETCPDCRHWLAQTTAVSKMIRDVPAASPPAGFTANVMAGLTTQRQGLFQRLRQRFAGPLRAPAPLVSAHQLVAAACVLLLIVTGGAFYSAHLNSGATSPDIGTGLVVADGTTNGAAHTPVAIGRAHPMSQRVVHARMDFLAVDDLVHHHDSYDLNRPLGSDPGVSLVSHSTR